MKSKFLFLFSLMLLACAVKAQDDDYAPDEHGYRKFSFGFNVGSGFPMGEYGSATSGKLPLSLVTLQDTSKISGYAKKGFHYDVNASYEIIPHLSIMLSVSGDKDDLDNNTLNVQYLSNFPANTLIAVYTPYEYYITQFLAGPKLTIPITEDCSFECKLLAGYTTASNPNITFYNIKDTIVLSYPTGKGFGYNIGAGIKYTAANGYFGMHFDINYAGSVVTYPGYTVFYSSGSTATNTTYNTSKTMGIGLLQLTVGLSLEL